MHFPSLPHEPCVFWVSIVLWVKHTLLTVTTLTSELLALPVVLELPCKPASLLPLFFTQENSSRPIPHTLAILAHRDLSLPLPIYTLYWSIAWYCYLSLLSEGYFASLCYNFSESKPCPVSCVPKQCLCSAGQSIFMCWAKAQPQIFSNLTPFHWAHKGLLPFSPHLIHLLKLLPWPSPEKSWAFLFIGKLSHVNTTSLNNFLLQYSLWHSSFSQSPKCLWLCLGP